MIGNVVLDILAYTKIVPSKAEGRRLIQQGGLTINENKIIDIGAVINNSDFKEGSLLLRKGKKGYFKVQIE